jgi:hypothetical protein
VKAGDRVKHRPTGEVWVLACDPEGGRVAWAGWPAGLAAEADCELVRECSKEERKVILERVAGIGPDETNALDWRTVVAKRQLEAERG